MSKQTPASLPERVRFAKAMILAGRHAQENWERDLEQCDAVIADFQAKRLRILKDRDDAPGMIARGEEELARCQRIEREAEESGTQVGSSGAKLARLMERREALLKQVAALQAEVDAAKMGGAS